MKGKKGNRVLIVVVAGLLSVQSFSQQFTRGDSLFQAGSGTAISKPRLSYSVASSFLYIPHYGTVTGFALAPSVSVPLSPKLRFEGGIIAGRFYPALAGSGQEVLSDGAFYSLSVYGSAVYQLNPQLSIYGSGVRQVRGASPFLLLPKSSYSLGSTYNFGAFSVGVAVQVSDRNSYPAFLPFNGTRGLFAPYGQNLPR